MPASIGTICRGQISRIPRSRENFNFCDFEASSTQRSTVSLLKVQQLSFSHKLTRFTYSQKGHSQRSFPTVLPNGNTDRRSDRLLQWPLDTQRKEADLGRRSIGIRRGQLEVQDQICENPGEADQRQEGTLQEAHGAAEAWMRVTVYGRPTISAWRFFTTSSLLLP